MNIFGNSLPAVWKWIGRDGDFSQGELRIYAFVAEYLNCYI